VIEPQFDRLVPDALPEQERAVGPDDREQAIPMSLLALTAPDQAIDEKSGASGGWSEVQPLSIGPVLARPVAEQSQSRAVETPDVTSANVARVAFVREEGLNLRSGPSQATSSMAQLPFGTRVHVLEDEARHPDWQKVTTPTGSVGYLYAKQVHFPPPDLIARDPGLRLIRVRPGQTMWGLVKEQYGIQGNESTADQNINHFINAIRAVNKSEAFTIETDWMDDIGNWAISGRDASDTLLRAGYDLWIPSFGVAAGMDVGSGTVTGEIARLIKKIEQKLKDFRDAGLAAGKYIPGAVAAHVGEAGVGLLKGLVDFALDAVKILAISTAVGALIGALFGGVGALPGAEIGFEIGLLILEAYGLAMLIELILSMAGQLLGQLASFVGQTWEANGDPKKIEDAGKTLAEAIGILAAAALLAAVAYLMKKGGQALAKTKFAKTIGQTELAKYMSDRANMKSTKEALAPKEPPPTTGGKGNVPPVVRSRGASGSGTGENFKLEDHPTVRDPVVEKRPGTARPTRPTTSTTKKTVKPPPRPTRGSTPEDLASVHGEATEGTGRGGRSPSDPEELNASQERRAVDKEELEKMSPRYEGDRFDAAMTEEDLALVAQELFPEYKYDPATKGRVIYRGGKPTRVRSKGSTVPDLYLRGRRARAGDPRLSPISLEAKNYYLGDAAVYDEFLSATAKQATQRAAALPKSAQQHVVIDLRGQNPPPGFLDRLRNDLAERSGGVLKPDRIHFLTSGAE
jgi:hypothetical protein